MKQTVEYLAIAAVAGLLLGVAARGRKEASPSSVQSKSVGLASLLGAPGWRPRAAGVLAPDREPAPGGISRDLPALRQIAEGAYRLGRSIVLELINAARTRVDARVSAIDLRAFTVQQELRILAMTGGVGA